MNAKAACLLGIGLGALICRGIYVHRENKREAAKLAEARRKIEPLLKDVSGYNKPSR